MTEDLQHLLEKIQKDGVEKAEGEASRIVDEANAKAEEILKNAKEVAEKVLKKAEQDAVTFEEKGRKALEQASRDVIISARTGIQAAIASVISAETAKALGEDETLSAMLLKVVDAYCAPSTSTEILVSEGDVEKFKGFILSKLSEEARQGIDIKPEGSILKGFKVILKDKNMDHDLTDKAITASLSQILRPHIADILDKSV